MHWASGSNVMLWSIGEVNKNQQAASKADALFNRRFYLLLRESCAYGPMFMWRCASHGTRADSWQPPVPY